MDAVDRAFDAVPRSRFLPRAARRRAAYDGPILIGHGQTNSQPRTVANMLRLLEVGEGHRVLDVGAGSGWTTALLEHLVGPSGEVHGVERVPELVATGSANLAAAGCRATIHPATEGVLGLPELAPFDRILVSAEPEELPEELVAQMNDELDGGPDGGARMVIPVRGTMLLVVRRGREAAVTEHGAYRFVPLLRD